ncbi:hypothetical protein NL676_018681 [Syzygium grande]|nr:hypothetical protein NL676_018681 [Syzygium grande]
MRSDKNSTSLDFSRPTASNFITYSPPKKEARLRKPGSGSMGSRRKRGGQKEGVGADQIELAAVECGCSRGGMGGRENRASSSRDCRDDVGFTLNFPRWN